MININRFRLYIYIFVNLLRFTRFFLLKNKINTKILQKIALKKNLFFKKKFRKKVLISKRLSIVLRKRKRYKLYKPKKKDKGNFFFKKHFVKTLYKNRKFLKHFFFLNKKVRQNTISKNILKTQNEFLGKNSTFEYTALNIALRSHFCLFLSDTLLFFKNNCFYLNGVNLTNSNIILNKYDCLQLKVSKLIYSYIKRSKKLLRKKTKQVRYNTWRFYKQKYFKKLQQLKPKKRKTPKFIYLFYVFKLNIPRFLEIDYFSLSIYILNKEKDYTTCTYYLNKLFTYKLFSLYNYKKIN